MKILTVKMFNIILHSKSSTHYYPKMKYYFVIFVAIIACINAAPTPYPANELEQVKAVLQPVQQEARALYDNAEFAVKDLTAFAAKSANELTASAKQLINPAERSLTGNIKEEVKSLLNEANGKTKALLEKAINDFEPMKSNEKALAIGARSALEKLENKILTKDGQDLVKALVGVAKKAI